jgi:hypothetical protein
MKKFIEFRDLEKVLGSSGKYFLEKLGNDLSEDRKYAIERLKLSGVCVDIYGSGKYKEILKSAVAMFIEKAQPEETLQKILNQAMIFNKLFQDFDELRDNTGVNTISSENQIPAFLIASEIFLSSLHDYSKGFDKETLQTKYPFVIAFRKSESILAPPEKVLAEIIHLNDKVMEQIGVVIKYLYHKGVPSCGLDSLVSIGEIKISRQHFALLERYEALFNVYEYWRFWEGLIYPETATKFKFEIENENFQYSQRIAVFRERIRRTKWMQDLSTIKDKISVDPETKSLPPICFRIPEEYLSVVFCKDLFGSDDLQERILNITLAEWIRAYTILQQISLDFLEKRIGTTKLTVRDWCIVKTKDEWVDALTVNGINQINAEVMIENLIFRPTSKDVIDCPLISLDDSLVILPSLAAMISPADAMLSNFNNKELLGNFRGRGFELSIIEMLAKQNIFGKNIKTSNGSEEYECDVVFVLDQDLFFVECKAFLQPETPRRYYEYIGKLTEAADQLNRISSFFEHNLEVVKTSLGLNNAWKANHIYKLILSSAMVGEPFFINNCFITDDSILKRFFDRESPGFRIGRARISPPDPNYEGVITSQKLLNSVIDPPQVNFTRGMMKTKYNNLELNNYSLSFQNFEETDMVVPGEKELRKLAKLLNVSYKFLKDKIDGK